MCSPTFTWLLPRVRRLRSSSSELARTKTPGRLPPRREPCLFSASLRLWRGEFEATPIGRGGRRPARGNGKARCLPVTQNPSHTFLQPTSAAHVWRHCMRWHRRAGLAFAAAAVAIGAGGVALGASTHMLPLTAGRDEAPSPTPAAHVPQIPRGGTGEPAAPDPTDGQGPNATGPAKFGLCTAYTSGQGGTNGDRFDSTAFQALATAAGGSANIAAFCADATPGG